MKRRILCVFLILTMLASLGAAAFAEETTGPEVIVEPEETAEPETAAEPEATAEPEETAEPEATAEPEETAEPEATAEPEETAEPEVTTEPEETAEPGETTEPEASTEPEETTEPMIVMALENDLVAEASLTASRVIHFLGATEGLVSAKDQNGKTVKEGDKVSGTIEITLKKAYTFVATVGEEWVGANDMGTTGEIYLDYIEEADASAPVVVDISAPAVLNLVGAVEGIASCRDGETEEELHQGALLPVSPWTPSYGEALNTMIIDLRPGYKLEKTGYIENGYIYDFGDYWYDANDEPVGYTYEAFAGNAGTLTITVVQDKTAKPKKMVPVQVISELSDDIYVAEQVEVGKNFIIMLNTECMINVEGATFVSGYGEELVYKPNADSKEIVITVEKQAPATLNITGQTGKVIKGSDFFALENGSSFTRGELLLAANYDLEQTGELDNCYITDYGYEWDYSISGFHHRYSIHAKTSGTITVNVVGHPHSLIPLRLEGATSKIECIPPDSIVDIGEGYVWGENADMARCGFSMTVQVKDGYTLEVQGGTIRSTQHYNGHYENYYEYEVTVGYGDELVLRAVKGNVLGDVTGSGAVESKDATELFRVVNKQISKTVDLSVGDVTHDGKVDAKDATQLFRFINKQIVTL